MIGNPLRKIAMSRTVENKDKNLLKTEETILEEENLLSLKWYQKWYGLVVIVLGSAAVVISLVVGILKYFKVF